MNCIDEMTIPDGEITKFEYILSVRVPVAATKIEEPSAKTCKSSDC